MSGKYFALWKNLLPSILEAINNGESKIQLDGAEFCACGNRPISGFHFRLDIVNGNIPVKSGSAVARDLKAVLDASGDFKKFAKDKNLTIRFTKDFILEILY